MPETLAKILITVVAVYVLLGLERPIRRWLAPWPWVRRSMDVLKTALRVAFLVVVLSVVWSSQVDVFESWRRFFSASPSHTLSWVATRDSTKLYQDHAPVADVVGPVRVENDAVFFEKLANAGQLDPSKPLEYRRMRLRIVDPGGSRGNENTITSSGVRTLRDVRVDVLCERVD